MKKLNLLMSVLFFSIFFGQVGINTVLPNGATVLDINSNAKGILIPRLTDTERDASLADNLLTTIPPTGVVNANLTAGTLIFNTTANRFEFWDGVVWRQLFVATSSQAGNDGVVKINGGAGGALPQFTLPSPTAGAAYGAKVQLVYTTPLTFAGSPTTSWPETTVPFPGNTSNIYIGTGTTQRWRENEVQGQVHVWRLIANVAPGNNSSASVVVSMENPDSGFNINSIALLPSQSSGAGNRLTFYFYTIADPASLDPGKGYQFFAQTQSQCTFQIESLTRVSLFKD